MPFVRLTLLFSKNAGFLIHRSFSSAVGGALIIPIIPFLPILLFLAAPSLCLPGRFSPLQCLRPVVFL
jgi:hypothetical protein